MSDVFTTLVNNAGALNRLPVGTELGRYVILELQGAGGMGVVYSAYDPKLDRRVALKLLRPSDVDAKEAGARLLREAQALAKLAHPNVVTVHDSGMIGDVVFVEMELVDGVTLDEWVEHRRWKEILEAYEQAGRALAAVHGVGLIHRDFKPTNAIVDKNGRVRVLDFGVARASTEDLDAQKAETTADKENDAEVVRVSKPSTTLDVPETAWGTATGTPGYMPPEQWRGTAIDARADQYAFAASLFKALYGALPFPDPTPAKMISEAARGVIWPRPPGTRVPMYVHRALVRALSYASGDRFASMEDLLATLTDDSAAAKRRYAVAAAVVIGFAVAITLLIRHERAREAGACANMAEKLDGAWDEAKSRRVHEAFSKSGNASAEEVWLRTKQLLDAYAGEWVKTRTQVCEESRHASRNVEDAALGARLVCLDWRLRDLRGLTDVLAADSQVLHGSVDAATGLAPIADCANPKLRDAVRPFEDPAGRAGVDAVRVKLAEVDAQRLAGRAKVAKPMAVAAVEEARKTNVRAAEGLALLALGRVQSADGDYKAAVVTLEQAAWAAEASRDDTTLAGATTDLAMVTGVRNLDATTAARWEKHAGAVLERLGSPDAPTAELERVRSMLAAKKPDLPDALAHAERALELSVRALGKDHPKVARAENNLANVFADLVRLDDAMVHYERSREIIAKAYGPKHPENATPLINEAIVHRKRADSPGALLLYRKALAILEPALGAEHPDVALVYNNMANALIGTGHLDEARASLERSAAIKRKVYGEEHPLVASNLSMLAYVDMKQHRYPEARAQYMQSLRMNEKLSGKESTSLCGALLGLANLELREKKPKDALALGERCLAIRKKKLGAEHPDVASPMCTVGRAHLAMGEAARAIPIFEQAAVLLDKERPELIADAEWGLARALRETSGSASRARALAVSAEARYAKEEVSNKDDLDEIHAWMAANAKWLAGTD